MAALKVADACTSCQFASKHGTMVVCKTVHTFNRTCGIHGANSTCGMQARSRIQRHSCSMPQDPHTVPATHASTRPMYLSHQSVCTFGPAVYRALGGRMPSLGLSSKRSSSPRHLYNRDERCSVCNSNVKDGNCRGGVGTMATLGRVGRLRASELSIDTTAEGLAANVVVELCSQAAAPQ